MIDKNNQSTCSPDHFTKWLAFVERFGEIHQFGKKLSSAQTPDVQEKMPPPIHADRHDIVICSPHPDDEALTGALAYRLMTQDTPVLNLAITLGNNQSRKEARRSELAASCKVLGFDCRLVQEPLGFSVKNGKKTFDSGQQNQIDLLMRHFDREKPKLVLFPHKEDGHPTHRNVHFLTMAALKFYSKKNERKVLIAETEYWHPIKKPNLMLGLNSKHIAGLITALTCHQGEIKRNPYHLTLPARLMDNVRRAAEISGYGRHTFDFLFAELYRLSLITEGGTEKFVRKSIIIPPEKGLILSELESLVR